MTIPFQVRRLPVDPLMRPPEVYAARGVSKSKHNDDVHERLWTAPVKDGPKFSAWPASEVAAQLAARAAGATPAQLRELVLQLEAARATRAAALLGLLLPAGDGAGRGLAADASASS